MNEPITHYAGCWRDHHECAVVLLGEALAACEYGGLLGPGPRLLFRLSDIVAEMPWGSGWSVLLYRMAMKHQDVLKRAQGEGSESPTPDLVDYLQAALDCILDAVKAAGYDHVEDDPEAIACYITDLAQRAYHPDTAVISDLVDDLKAGKRFMFLLLDEIERRFGEDLPPEILALWGEAEDWSMDTDFLGRAEGVTEADGE